MNSSFASYDRLKPAKPFTVQSKKIVAKIDMKPKKKIDKRCKVDQLLGIDKPTTGHTGAETNKKHDEERNFKKIVKSFLGQWWWWYE